MERFDKYDELYLLEAIQDAGLKNVQVIEADEIKQKMLDTFVDFSLNKSDDRLFLNFKEGGALEKLDTLLCWVLW
ncbi:hypothetical protein [Xylocopilactobacillus apis]|nr:hypothetical protein [Xylocopilactobacillus apis]